MKKAVIGPAAAEPCPGAAAAGAARVETYGLIDMGFSATRKSGDHGSTSDFWASAMNSGQRNSSRTGSRGSEETAPGRKVSFVPEDQFKTDSGALRDGSTFREREAGPAASSPCGKVPAGRLGALSGPAGTAGLCTTGSTSPFGSMTGSFVACYKAVAAGDHFPINNSVVCAPPKFGGLEFFARYSFGSGGDSGTMDANGRCTNGPFRGTSILDTTDEAGSSPRSGQPSPAAPAVNHGFGFVKPFLCTQHCHSGKLDRLGSCMAAACTGSDGASPSKYDGFGGMFTLRVPVSGCQGKAEAGFTDAEPSDSAVRNDLKRVTPGTGCDCTPTGSSTSARIPAASASARRRRPP